MCKSALVLFLILAPLVAHAAAPARPNAFRRLIGLGHDKEVKQAIKLAKGMSTAANADAVLLGAAHKQMSALPVASLRLLMRALRSTQSQADAALAYIGSHADKLDVAEAIAVTDGIVTILPESLQALDASLSSVARSVSGHTFVRPDLWKYHPNETISRAGEEIERGRAIYAQGKAQHDAVSDRLHDEALVQFVRSRGHAVGLMDGMPLGPRLSAAELVALAGAARTEATRQLLEDLAARP